MVTGYDGDANVIVFDLKAIDAHMRVPEAYNWY